MIGIRSAVPVHGRVSPGLDGAGGHLDIAHAYDARAEGDVAVDLEPAAAA